MGNPRIKKKNWASTVGVWQHMATYWQHSIQKWFWPKCIDQILPWALQIHFGRPSWSVLAPQLPTFCCVEAKGSTGPQISPRMLHMCTVDLRVQVGSFRAGQQHWYHHCLPVTEVTILMTWVLGTNFADAGGGHMSANRIVGRGKAERWMHTMLFEPFPVDHRWPCLRRRHLKVWNYRSPLPLHQDGTIIVQNFGLLSTRHGTCFWAFLSGVKKKCRLPCLYCMLCSKSQEWECVHDMFLTCFWCKAGADCRIRVLCWLSRYQAQ